MATETSTEAQDAPRPMRADARRNYDRLLAQARSAFTEHGTDTSLEDVARRAGVGIGTLYRHFPNRTALMGAVFRSEVHALLARSRELAEAPQPCRALIDWLRAIVDHASTYRGLSQALMACPADGSSALSRWCEQPMREAGAVLLARAQRTGSVRADVDIVDLMRLTNAVALAVEQAPDDPGLAERLLALAFTGIKAR